MSVRAYSGAAAAAAPVPRTRPLRADPQRLSIHVQQTLSARLKYTPCQRPLSARESFSVGHA